MNNEKLTANASVMDMVMTISEGNRETIIVVMEMLQDYEMCGDILLLDSLGVRGRNYVCYITTVVVAVMKSLLEHL